VRDATRRFITILSLLASGLLGSAAASAHGGEDHGDEGKPRPAPAFTAAPRATAQSEEFELVAVLEEGPSGVRQLTVTLDRFATNEPVAGAKLEIDAEGQSTIAPETAPGVYVAKLAALAKAGPGTKLPLTISVEAGDDADLLTTTLDIPAPATAAEAHSHGWEEYASWTAGAVIALMALALLVVRRLRQQGIEGQ
jgi:hypothetical protein